MMRAVARQVCEQMINGKLSILIVRNEGSWVPIKNSELYYPNFGHTQKMISLLNLNKLLFE